MLKLKSIGGIFMARIFDLLHSDIMNTTGSKLKEIIRLSEGRTVMSETVISKMSLVDGISNPETARAFGADLVTLNTFDMYNPFIFGYDDSDSDLFGGMGGILDGFKTKIEVNKKNPQYLQEFKALVGRHIGVNLEPIRSDIPYPKGFILNEETLLKAKELGFDYIVITANPKTNVSSEDILWGIQEARRVIGDSIMIVAGRMHGSGLASFDSVDSIESFAKAGADVVLLPAPKTVPGVTKDFALEAVKAIHNAGALAMSAIGTSQEGASTSVIESIALDCKECGFDIQHIGDAGFSGMASPENIMALSIAIRGKRHTYRQIARSIRR